LFKSRDSLEAGHGAGADSAGRGMPAMLPHSMIIPPQSEFGEAAAGTGQVLRRSRPIGEHYAIWRDALSARLSNLDLAPDLARDIGSVRWFRGVGTMVGLSIFAAMFWPQFAPLEAAPPMQIDETARDEFRSQMIMPLALGGDSGRHMGATAAVIPLQSAPERPSIELVATLAQGDSFARMLQRAGVGKDQAEALSIMVGGAMPLEDIKPGTKVDIVLGRRPEAGATRPLDSLAFRARFDLELAVERRGNSLVLDPRPIKVDTTPLRIRAPVGASLYRSARAAGAPPKAIQQYLRTLGDYVDFERGIGANDEFDLIISYKRAATGEVELGELLYAGIIRDGKPKTQLMRWGKDNIFYEASGAGEQRSGMVSPVPGRITSRYGMRRHPILGYRRMHKGLDFKASYGTPIYAVSDGTVKTSGRNGGHGNYVRLSHGNGLDTGYSHMSRIAVSRGQRVRRGQVIGYVGSTGLSTGPHLHYEMYRGGQNIDPSSVKFVTQAQLSKAELTQFRAALDDLLTVAPGEALARLAPDPEFVEEPTREIDRVQRPRQVG
jgi:murein DD-endopeptidase MepM/ murein hydrolase activator NlpD